MVIAAGGPGNARRPAPRNNVLYHQTLVAFALPRPGDPLIDLVTPYPTRAPGPGQELQAAGGSGNFVIAPVAGAGRGGRGGRGAAPD